MEDFALSRIWHLLVDRTRWHCPLPLLLTDRLRVGSDWIRAPFTRSSAYFMPDAFDVQLIERVGRHLRHNTFCRPFLADCCKQLVCFSLCDAAAASGSRFCRLFRQRSESLEIPALPLACRSDGRLRAVSWEQLDVARISLEQSIDLSQPLAGLARCQERDSTGSKHVACDKQVAIGDEVTDCGWRFAISKNHDFDPSVTDQQDFAIANEMSGGRNIDGSVTRRPRLNIHLQQIPPMRLQPCVALLR